MSQRLSLEMRSESEKGVGKLTRALLAAFTLRDTANLRTAYRAWKNGQYPRLTGRSTPQVEELAQELIVDAKNVPLRWRAERKLKNEANAAARTPEPTAAQPLSARHGAALL